MANNTPISTKRKMEHKENTTTWTEMHFSPALGQTQKCGEDPNPPSWKQQYMHKQMIKKKLADSLQHKTTTHYGKYEWQHKHGRYKSMVSECQTCITDLLYCVEWPVLNGCAYCVWLNPVWPLFLVCKYNR
jgi:hypothetical protein